MEKDFSQYVTSIDDFITRNQDAIVRDIARLVAVPSDSPENVPEALQTVLTLAASMGLAVHNENNIIGWAQVGQTQEKYLATITHTDVVPPGEGWDSDPFKLEQKEGWLIGRGVVDDKGAAILTLYLLKFFQEQAVPLRYPIRALFGTDEETGMSDVHTYLSRYPAPVFCFTPDADFPLCNGEKGHYNGKIVSVPSKQEEILEMQGGFAPNAVPGTAQATVRFSQSTWKETPGIEAHMENGLAIVTATGKSGHASLPEGTVNAIALLVDALLKNQVGNPEETAYLKVLKQIHAATDGSSLGIQTHDAYFSPLTIIGGMIKKQQGKIIQTIDCRFPTSIDADKITAALKHAAGEAAEVIPGSFAVPFHISENHPAIQACLEAYEQEMQTTATPFTMGGGTYARHFPCAVSFGPQPPDLVRPDFAGTEHGANEAIPLQALLKALKIYIAAMLKLQSLSL